MRKKQAAKIILLTLCLFLLPLSYLKSRQIKDYFYGIYFTWTKKDEIKNWFNDEALNYNSENLHYGSAWSYLTREQFKEMVLDGTSKMDPQINKHEKIFEFGVGVGATLKVIEDDIGTDQLEMWGSDIAENAISQAKKTFSKQSDHFFVWDMTQIHSNTPDNHYDHVLSFGALAMYLTKNDMKQTIKEAVRITKPGGSLLFTSFIAPGGKRVGSIVAKIAPDFFEENAQEWGIENVKTYPMKHQGDRYLVTFNKKKD